MSIPKEPRQLMINLMYLVLTAMLALNVSAEIINAFFRIDNSIEQTNKLLNTSNTKTLAAMQAEVDKKANYRPLLELSKEAQQLVTAFNSYIDEIRTGLDTEAGGLVAADNPDKTIAGLPLRFKDKDIPQRYFVDGYQGKAANGPLIKQRIAEVRGKLLALLDKASSLNIDNTSINKDDIERLKRDLPLQIDDQSWKDFGKKSWEQFNFGYMPVAACYPILRKFQNDARNSESAIINYLASQIGAKSIEFDKFQPVASSEKSYIIAGEKFSADLFLSAFSSQASDAVSIRVNGSNIPVKGGIGHYEITPQETGEKSYKVDINVKNPYTGKVESYSKTFSYEVGRRSVAVSADKMNVFYIGMDNPVSVSAAGVSSNKLKVSANGVDITQTGVGKYNVIARKPGDASIIVSAPGMPPTEYKYRVKKVPTPMAKMSGKLSGNMGSGEMRAQDKLYAEIENFDFDIKCQIVGFKMTRTIKNGDPFTVLNESGNFNGDVKRLLGAVKPGEICYFFDVKGKCPGDVAPRELNSLAFTIK